MSNQSITPEAKFAKTFGFEFIQEATVHLNLKQDVVIITGDKLELCLRNHLGCVSSKGGWVTPASLFVTFLATLCASTFHDWGLKANVWEALFLLLTIGSFLWLIFAIIQASKVKTSLETLIKEIKKLSQVANDTKQ